ncbi:unnamed protein product, partial [Mesorhabditis spiculigera]
MLYSHVTLLMLRVVDVVAKTTVQQSARMLIGALFPLHRQMAGAEGCGEIWEQYGIQRTEVALKTVKEWNKRLPFRLGITIRDTCWNDRISMEQTIAFLREGMLTSGLSQCPCCQTPGCNRKTVPVVAVVGPGKSSATIAVQNLLQVFRIPQLAYSATTPDLSDKEQFGYFMRVVPSDVWQAKAIYRILENYNWSYVAVVYTVGKYSILKFERNYGEKGFAELQSMSLNSSAVCIAFSEKVKSLANPEEFQKILITIHEQRVRPQVVVCFCEGITMRGFLKAQEFLRGHYRGERDFSKFQWIGSDGWADRKDVIDGLENEANGSFSIRIHSPRVRSFDQYYMDLNPENNTQNPWFREFWQQKFNCTFLIAKEEKNKVDSKQLCTGQESLEKGYEQDPKLSQVINAVNTIARALLTLYNDKCKSINKTDCADMMSKNGTLLYEYMRNVTFTDEYRQDIYFDKRGDPPAWYDILNYAGPRIGYRDVGRFKGVKEGEELRIVEKPIFVTGNQVPESVCSKPCRAGYRKRVTGACCWICEKCADNQIVNSTVNECVDCPIGLWPDANKTACYELEIETSVDWTDLGAVVAIIFAVTGMLATSFTILTFVRYNNTPVVKSTTRELSYIILGGIMACYAVTFLILWRPTFPTCFLTRIIPPIAFSIVYSALLTKTNRIARILAGSKKRILTKKPRFLSTFSQVVITWILVGVQCVIVGISVIKEMPAAGYNPVYLPKKMVLICVSSDMAFLTPFFWNLCLITLCTLYAVKTRNLPENFNEAKFIGFTMYCTLVVWGAFMVLHLGQTNKALTMSFSFSISASVALMLLFAPKLWIIIIHPEKNVRSSYTTTKLIRCHFGNSQGGTFDSKHNASSKTTRASTQSASLSHSSGVTRTASVHVVSHPSGHTDAQTQTDPPASKFSRTFSIAGKPGKKVVDDDVQLLVDACRRYQDERLRGAESNLLLEEAEDEGQGGDEVGALLVGSIGNSMRAVLSTMGHGTALGPTTVPSKGATRPSEGRPSRQLDEDFEELLRSRGVQPLGFHTATPL